MELFFLAVLVCLMAWSLARGFPVAFSLPGSAILSIGLAALCGWLFVGDSSAYFHQGGPSEWLNAGVTNLRGIYWEVERDTLIAIPLFIFMGIMLQRSKIAEDLLLTMTSLFGSIPGGLGISVVFVGALLAATTGILGATVVSMGLISLPAMLRKGYSPALASGTIAASGTLGQIIPPSIVLIILADQLSSAADQAGAVRTSLYKHATGDLNMPSQFAVDSTSAGEMFLGAVIPGLVLVGLYMVFILITALLRPSSAPAAPYEGKIDHKFLFRVLLALIPPLSLIFIVLGSIIFGVATVNQAGAIGAVGALIMAGYRLYEGKAGALRPAILALASIVVIIVTQMYFDVNIKSVHSDQNVSGIVLSGLGVVGLLGAILWSAWRAYVSDNTLNGVMIETAKTTSLVFIILLGAAMLTAAFRAFGGEELVRNFLTGLPGGFWMQFFIVMLVIFLLGFFLDFIEIAVVVVPIVAPILLANPEANVTAVWLGVMIGLNMQTSFLTPPFGFALFYLRGVAPAVVKTWQIYKGVIPFIALQLAGLGIVGFVPQLVNYLPNRIVLTSNTASPPINPKLQFCVDTYSAQAFAQNGEAITQAISALRGADLSVLPADVAADLETSLKQAEEAPHALQASFAMGHTVEAAAVAYRPILSNVRRLEAELRRVDAKIKGLQLHLSRMGVRGTEYSDLEADISALKHERAELAAEIPSDWNATQSAFRKLLQEEDRKRKIYHQLADNSYDSSKILLARLKATHTLIHHREELQKLHLKAQGLNVDASGLVEGIKVLTRAIHAVPETSHITALLSKARKALPKQGAVQETEGVHMHLSLALEALNKDIAWQKAAQPELMALVERYEAALRGISGIRKQRYLTNDQALHVASCKSDHRDLSVYF